ncbi:YcxB family protein [Altericista sp. CCNU0014]|uniref:YcxB family protein n=1 Tax=Altericista sp. CCNU0014 TaxID=3082949 RepID=UPI00384B9490
MNSQPIAILSYQLSANDYLRAAEIASSNKILSLLSVTTLTYGGLRDLLRAVQILPDVSYETMSASDYWLSSLVCLLSSFLFLHLAFPRFSPTKRWTIARTWKRTIQMQQPITLSIAEAGVEFQIQGFRDFRQWQHYTGFRETKEMFLLFYSGSLYRILPKRIFSSPEQMRQFQDLLDRNGVASQKNSNMD